MISEKEMMIVDAVNKLEGELPGFNEFPRNPYGFYLSGCNIFLIGSNKPCFSVKLYNQCIHEMSVGAFVPNAKPEFVYGQDVYLKDDNVVHEKAFKFGCYHPDGVNCLLTSTNGYAIAKVSSVIAKPVKTKEDIELEDAKKKQVTEAAIVIHKAESDEYGLSETTYEDYLSAAKELQSAGLLAEILLPLKPKQ